MENRPKRSDTVRSSSRKSSSTKPPYPQPVFASPISAHAGSSTTPRDALMASKTVKKPKSKKGALADFDENALSYQPDYNLDDPVERVSFLSLVSLILSSRFQKIGDANTIYTFMAPSFRMSVFFLSFKSVHPTVFFFAWTSSDTFLACNSYILLLRLAVGGGGLLFTLSHFMKAQFMFSFEPFFQIFPQKKIRVHVGHRFELWCDSFGFWCSNKGSRKLCLMFLFI
jgi:hypothetical protein